MRSTVIKFLAGWLLTTGVAWSQVTFESVREKLKSAKQYHIKLHYEGPWGVFDLDYTYALVKDKHGFHHEIRTEIERSQNTSYNGSVLLYDESWAPNKVRIRTNGGIAIRNTSHPEIKGRAIHEPLFQLFLDKMQGSPVTSVPSGDETLFTLQTPEGTYRVWVNSKSEIRLIESVEDGKKVTRRIFSSEMKTVPSETPLSF